MKSGFPEMKTRLEFLKPDLMVNPVVKWGFEVGRAAKGGTCAGTCSPAPPLHYLARIATLHYDRQPGQEGDAEKR